MDFDKLLSHKRNRDNMDYQALPFLIYHDPPEEHNCSTKLPLMQDCHPQSTRVVLAEIRLPSWANCDSALKHEMLPTQPEPLSDLPHSDRLSSQEFKENFISKSMRALCLKTPPRKSLSPGLNTPSCAWPAKSNAPSSVSRLPPGLKHTPHIYTTQTSLCSPLSLFRT